jgi:CRISPR-associated endonuclease/helicase Cas3
LTLFSILDRFFNNSITVIPRDRESTERFLATKSLLIGTQTIEVSLDIDYDVCFSGPAPVDALTRRFGRVNLKKGPDGFPLKGICDVYLPHS